MWVCWCCRCLLVWARKSWELTSVEIQSKQMMDKGKDLSLVTNVSILYYLSLVISWKEKLAFGFCWLIIYFFLAFSLVICISRQRRCVDGQEYNHRASATSRRSELLEKVRKNITNSVCLMLFAAQHVIWWKAMLSSQGLMVRQCYTGRKTMIHLLFWRKSHCMSWLPLSDKWPWMRYCLFCVMHKYIKEVRMLSQPLPCVCLHPKTWLLSSPS